MEKTRGDALFICWTEANAAKLALETDAVGVVWGGGQGGERGAALRLGVVVVVVEVARSVVVPAGYRADEAGGVELADALGQSELGMGVGDLAPAFVVEDPREDARVALVLVDHGLELPLELGLLGVGGPGVGRDAHRRHVLHDEEAELVAGLVEEVWFDLDMLADHVHAEFLDDFEVVDHGFESGWCVDAVRPEPLIERAEQKQGLSVEKRALDVVDDAGGDGAEAGVALDLVRVHSYRDVIQRRRVGSPELWRRDGKGECLVRYVFVRCHLLPERPFH